MVCCVRLCCRYLIEGGYVNVRVQGELGKCLGRRVFHDEVLLILVHFLSFWWFVVLNIEESLLF